MGFVSFLAFFNTAQNLLSTKLTKQVYSRRPIEGGLLCHAMLVFGEAGKGDLDPTSLFQSLRCLLGLLVSGHFFPPY
jgi:hypothetical protein